MDAARENIRKYASGNQEDNLCRLCFVKAFKLRNVFPYGGNPNNDLFRQISSLALVTLNSSEEPDCCICSRCVTNLEEFAKFQRQCVDYNRLLRMARGQPVQPLKPAANKPRDPKREQVEPEVEDPFEGGDANIDDDDDVEEEVVVKRPERTRKRPAKLGPLPSPVKKRVSGPVKQVLNRSKECDDTAAPKATSRKTKKPIKEESESSDEFDEDATESDDSFKPPVRSRAGRPSKKAATAAKPAGGRKPTSTNHDSSDAPKSRSKLRSSTDYKVNNAGHGMVNIVFDKHCYFKFRYSSKSRRSGEVRYIWQCIEKDCVAHIQTKSGIKGTIFWRDRTMQHNHEPDDVDELLTAKIEDTSYDRAAGADALAQVVRFEGRKRHNYTRAKLPSGEEVFVYGDHQHRLLKEKANGISVYGCIISTCRSIIHHSDNGDMQIYSGTSSAPEESFELSYRKTTKVLSFDGYYYINSGRRIENRCAVWWCLLRRSHNCLTLLHVQDGDQVVTNRYHVKVPHTHSVDDYKLDVSMMVTEARPGDLPIESTDYHVAKNQTGRDFIIFEGIRYIITNTRVDGTKGCRCTETQFCGAYIYLSPNGTIVKFTNDNEHSHDLPEQRKGIEEFDFAIETAHVERTGSMFKFYNGNEYKLFNRRDNSTLYYRCTRQRSGCSASLTASPDFSVLRENPEPHNHLPAQVEQERRKALLEHEGTTDYQIEYNPDGYDVMMYKQSRYCHFYNHKEGWRVWRCFSGTRCTATLFQNRTDGRVCDVERFEHKHDPVGRVEKVETESHRKAAVTKKEPENESWNQDSDSDSRNSADWF